MLRDASSVPGFYAIQPSFRNLHRGPGMHRENDRDPFCNLSNCIQGTGQLLLVIYIGWPVKRQDRILPGNETKLTTQRGLMCKLQRADQRINHQIADKVYFFRWNSFMSEILIAAFLGCKEKIGNRVCKYPVDFFRHSAVKAAQTRFHMDHRYLFLCSDQSASDG